MVGEFWRSADTVEKVGVELFTRFSRVALPLTKTNERLVGRSERSKFSPAARNPRAATFSTTSANLGRSTKVSQSATIWAGVAAKGVTGTLESMET